MTRKPNLPTQLLVALTACGVCTLFWTITYGADDAMAMGVVLFMPLTAILLALRLPQLANRLPRVALHTRHFWRFVPRKRLAVISLFLAVPAVCLLVRSHMILDNLIIRSSGNSTVRLASFQGRLLLDYNRSSSAMVTRPIIFHSMPVEWGRTTMDESPKSFDWAWYGQSSPGWSATSLFVLFPQWLSAMFLAMPLLFSLGIGMSRFRREHATRCIHCGYNLTGNTSGVCPECGASI